MYKQNVNKQKGFTLVEVMIAIAVGLTLLIAFLPQIEQAFFASDSAKFRTHVLELNKGAAQYKAKKNVMTGASMAEFKKKKFISKKMDDGAGKNPWGGDYTIAVSSTNPTQYVITGTGVQDADVGAELAAEYAESIVAATFSGTTITLTFQG